MTQQSEGERRATRVVVAVAIAVLTVGGSFIVGRMTAPADKEGSAVCSAANAALDRLLEEGKGAPADEQQDVKDTRLLTLSNVVLQNPDCFDTEMRAQAQTAKDQVASNESSAAASENADRITQCLSRINVGFGC